MRMALVRDGVVENIIIAEPGFDPGEGVIMVPSDVAASGWTHDAFGFHPPPFVEDVADVPAQIALWQARAVLERRGLLAAANSAVTLAGDEVLRAVWEYGNVISRSSPGLAALASALGLSGADVDALFREAAALDA